MTTPLFTADRHLNDEEFKTQWFNYSRQYFKSTNVQESITTALDYNLDQINNKLNNPELVYWTRVLLVAKDFFKPGTFYGGYLRQFYEKAERSEANFQLTSTLLEHKASNLDRVDFLRKISDNHETYTQFYSKTNYKINDFMAAVLNTLTNYNSDKQRSEFLLGFVFSPYFVEQKDKYVINDFIFHIHYLENRLEYLFGQIFNTDTKKINFLISSLYVLDRSIDETVILSENNTDDYTSSAKYKSSMASKAPGLHQKITSLFETTFPDTYKQYQLMKNLDLNLSLQEMSASLCTHTDTPAQPLSTIEF